MRDDELKRSILSPNGPGCGSPSAPDPDEGEDTGDRWDLQD